MKKAEKDVFCFVGLYQFLWSNTKSQPNQAQRAKAQTVKLLTLNQSEFEEKATENRDWVSSVFSAKH